MNKKSGPPKLPHRFFQWYCHPDYLEDIEGDLLERFEKKVEEKGGKAARLGFFKDVIQLFRPGIIRSFQGIQQINQYDMFKNNFKIALRRLLKHKFYTIINVSGLTIGITCCMLIFQYVAFEYSFDTFNENSATLFRISQTTVQNEGEPRIQSRTGWAMAPALAQDVPEVNRFCRLHPEYFNAIVSNPAQPDKAFEEARVYYADSTFFQMFSYPLLSGNPAHALAKPGTVMLSESTARKYFGDEDPLGQSLDVTGWISGTFRVDGVFRDVPVNSSLQFDMLLPMVDLLEKSGFNDPSTGWGWTNFITFIQLQKNANPSSVAEKFTRVAEHHMGEEWRQTNTTGHVHILPILDVHLNTDTSVPKTVTGSYRMVYFYSIIGLVILLIALINYINLTTARALDRGREVGIRKVVGARRGQLIVQFFAESTLVILIAFTLAVLLSDLARPALNRLAGLNITNGLLMNSYFWMALVGLLCLTTLVAGLYPAFVLSSFKPGVVLKGRIAKTAISTRLRRGLVVFQFTATIVLLVGITVVYTQLNYIRHRNLGINLNQILIINAPRVLSEGTDRVNMIETFTQELHRFSTVGQTATSGTVPGKGFNYYSNNIRKAAANLSEGISGVVTTIDTSFATLYGLKLIAASQGFNNMATPEEGEPKNFIVNETAAYALGFDSPEEAINQEINMEGSLGLIVGVFKDFSWSSAHTARENMLFFIRPGNAQISIKVNTGNLPETIVAIEELYRQSFPGNPFQYTFADDTFDAQYRSDQQFAKLVSVFTVLAIVIACMGLFGLAAFTAEQRTKEIGIRKVLGASVSGIVSLMAKNFVGTIVVSFLLASPLAWYMMHQWLQDFVYRINIQWWMFATAGFLVLLIALLTVSFQSIKAATTNPVDSLRNE